MKEMGRDRIGKKQKKIWEEKSTPKLTIYHLQSWQHLSSTILADTRISQFLARHFAPRITKAVVLKLLKITDPQWIAWYIPQCSLRQTVEIKIINMIITNHASIIVNGFTSHIHNYEQKKMK